MDRYEIYYNGSSGLEHGVFLPEYPSISQPEKNYETYSVPGRNGELISTSESVGNVEIECVFSVVDRNFDNRIRDLKKWLRGTGKLRFSGSPEYFYEVLVIDYNSLEQELRRYGQFTATFTCYPYEFKDDGQREYAPENLIYNPNDLCKPIYKITGEGNYTLKVNGKTVTANVGQNLTIDTRNMIAYRSDGTLMNTSITGKYDDLWIPNGDISIQISGGSLVVIPQWGFQP